MFFRYFAKILVTKGAPLVSTTPVARWQQALLTPDLPPVSTTPVVTTFLKFKMIAMTPAVKLSFSSKFELVLLGNSEAWCKMIHEKTSSKKSRDTLSVHIWCCILHRFWAKPPILCSLREFSTGKDPKFWGSWQKILENEITLFLRRKWNICTKNHLG